MWKVIYSVTFYAKQECQVIPMEIRGKVHLSASLRTSGHASKPDIRFCTLGEKNSAYKNRNRCA